MLHIHDCYIYQPLVRRMTEGEGRVALTDRFLESWSPEMRWSNMSWAVRGVEWIDVS